MKVFSFVWCASGCVSFCVLLFVHWLERRWSDGRYILHIQLNHCFSGPTTSYRWINIGKYKKQNVDDNINKRNKRLINRQTTIKKKSKYTKSNNNHRRRCVNCTAIKLHKDILPYVKKAQVHSDRFWAHYFSSAHYDAHASYCTTNTPATTTNQKEKQLHILSG